mgnify:CR=1 FL=1
MCARTRARVHASVCLHVCVHSSVLCFSVSPTSSFCPRSGVVSFQHSNTSNKSEPLSAPMPGRPGCAHNLHVCASVCACSLAVSHVYTRMHTQTQLLANIVLLHAIHRHTCARTDACMCLRARGVKDCADRQRCVRVCVLHANSPWRGLNQ